MIDRVARRARVVRERALARMAWSRLEAEESRLASRPSSHRTRIAVVFFCDTRENLRQAWEHNARIVEHNFRTLEARLPGRYSLHYFAVFHEVTHQPAVEDLLQRLAQGRSLEVIRLKLNLSSVDRAHKFNFIVRQSLSVLGPRLRNHDYVFMNCQDAFLANHLEQNFLDVLINLADGKPTPLSEPLRHEGRPSSCYVGHSTGVNPNWPIFTHNSTIGWGLFPVRKLPYVERSAVRSGTWIAAEGYLGEVLRQPCTYLKASPNFCFGFHDMHELTPQKADELLRMGASPEGTRQFLQIFLPERRRSYMGAPPDPEP